MSGIEFLEMINDMDLDLIDMAARTKTSAVPSGKKRSWIVFAVPAAIIAAAVLLSIGIGYAGRNPNGSGPSMIVASLQTTAQTEETTTSRETSGSPDGSADNAATKPAAISNTTATIGDDEQNAYSQEGYDHSHDDNEETGQDNADTYDEPDPGDGDGQNGSDLPAPVEYRVMSIEWAMGEELPQAEEEDMVCFWEDDDHAYYIDRQILATVAVIYENGEYEDLVSALSCGRIEISDLDAYGVPYYAE